MDQYNNPENTNFMNGASNQEPQTNNSDYINQNYDQENNMNYADQSAFPGQQQSMQHRKKSKLVPVIIIAIIAAVVIGGGLTAWHFIKNSEGSVNQEISNPQEIIDKTIEALGNVDECHSDITYNMSASADGTEATVSLDMNLDSDYKNGLFHTTGDISARSNSDDNVKTSMESYVKYNSSGIGVYSKVDNVWNGVEYDALTSSIMTRIFKMDNAPQFGVGSLEDISGKTTDLDGKKVYCISGNTVLLSDTSNLDTILNLAAISDANVAMQVEQVKELLNSLKPVSVTAYIDKDTYLPIKLEFDLSDITKSVFDYSMSQQGMSYDIDVSNSKMIIDFSDYNSIDAISIPPAAKDSAVKFDTRDYN
ncbi:MAG: hypothetical protein J1G06_00005 [Oscillospiraceae bacterium]|nr:hypothetical protein [Oscillospiraceae bacterium]